MSEKITVNTSSENEYDLYFGDNLSVELKAFIDDYSSEKAFVLVDAFVLEHHREHFEAVLAAKFSTLHVFEVPRGETSKSFEVYKKAVDFVLSHGAERSSPLFAIGGGVTGDLAGFVAATVLRGISLVHIPTTLLSMVDSSIGGKTGINHTVGKNLIGSFYQPDAVFADVHYLQTLERKEWVNGLSEVLKYGMIHSPDILEQVSELIAGHEFEDVTSWLPLIRQSAQIKTDIVKKDVLESGIRAYLNFGHTFAHVIERIGNYKRFSHGEAVYAGMIAAVHASNSLGSSIDPSNLLEFKTLYNFSLESVNSSEADLVEIMKKDKKVKNEIIRLILLKQKGEPYVYKVKDTAFVEQAWQYTLEIFQ